MFSIRLILAMFISLSFLGCSTAEVEKYVYNEGDHGKDISIEETYWNEVIYKKGDYEFFPRFYSLSRSYSSPNSTLVIYSSKKKDIYLKKITIESAKGTFSDHISFEKVIALEKFHEKRKSNYIGLSLFDHDNTNLPQYWDEGDIKVTLSYIDSSENNNEIIFEFKLWKGSEIVWPT